MDKKYYIRKSIAKVIQEKISRKKNNILSEAFMPMIEENELVAYLDKRNKILIFKMYITKVNIQARKPENLERLEQAVRANQNKLFMYDFKTKKTEVFTWEKAKSLKYTKEQYDYFNRKLSQNPINISDAEEMEDLQNASKDAAKELSKPDTNNNSVTPNNDYSESSLNAIQSTTERARVINQKYGTDYQHVFKFQNGIANAITKNKEYTVINIKGQDVIQYIEFNDKMLNDIENDKVRALFINRKYGTKYIAVSKFNNGVATAKTEDGKDIQITLKDLESDKTKNKSILDTQSSSTSAQNSTVQNDTVQNDESEEEDDGEERKQKDDSYDKSEEERLNNMKWEDRTKFINEKYNTNYLMIWGFKNSLALAQISRNEYTVINLKGQDVIDSVEPTEELLNSANYSIAVARIINRKYNTNYKEVEEFKNGIAVARINNNELTVINLKGEDVIDSVELTAEFLNSLDYDTRRIIINRKYNTSYRTVNKFNDGVALAEISRNEFTVINLKGQDVIDSVELTDKILNSLVEDYQRAYLIRRKHKIRYNAVSKFNDGVALAEISRNEFTVINLKGQDVIDSVKLTEKLLNSIRYNYQRTFIINRKYNTNYKKVEEFKNGVALAEISETEYTFINLKGEDVIDSIELTEELLNSLENYSQRTIIINRKYNTNYKAVFGFKKEVAEAITEDGERVKINLKGKIIEKLNESITQAQKLLYEKWTRIMLY